MFAPTHRLRECCLEVSVTYWRLPSTSTTYRQLGWYDFCSPTPGWQLVEDMTDQTWADTYSDSTALGPYSEVRWIAFFVRAVPGTSCWDGLLFNHALGEYEEKAYSCGVPSTISGWSVWESWQVMESLTD